MSERVLHILTEAAALFAERGYDGTGMRDLAERCGVSKSLLYHHFADKGEIYDRIALGFTQELHDYVASRIPEQGPVRERVGAFMTATAEFFERYRLVWLASTNAFWTDPGARQSAERLRWRDAFEKMLRVLLAEGVRSGELAGPDAPMAGRLILSALNWLPRWYQPNGARSAVDIAAEFHRMVFDGLSARPAITAARRSASPPAPARRAR